MYTLLSNLYELSKEIGIYGESTHKYRQMLTDRISIHCKEIHTENKYQLAEEKRLADEAEASFVLLHGYTTIGNRIKNCT